MYARGDARSRLTSTLVGGLLVGAFVAAVGALTAYDPPDRLPHRLALGAGAGDGGVTLLTSAVAAVAWAVVIWLVLSCAVALVGRLPGTIGRYARRVAARVTPSVLRRLVGGGAAIGVALAPLALPGAASATGCAPASPTAHALPSLDRPAPACPAPTPAVRPALHSAAHPIGPPATAPTGVGHLARVDARRSSAPTVVVRSGDSLWRLARAELDAAGRPSGVAAVAARWPAWWSANRDEIGPDPDLLLPGTILRAPATR